jgi:hypothetical protein
MYPAKTAATLCAPVTQLNECPFIVVLNHCVISWVREWRSRMAKPFGEVMPNSSFSNHLHSDLSDLRCILRN